MCQKLRNVIFMKTQIKTKVKTFVLMTLAAVALITSGACSGSDDNAQADDLAETEPRDSIGELVSRVRATDRLYTSEYQVHKLVSFDDVRRLRGSLLGKKFDVRLPQGDRKVLIPVDAVIKGYIDFSGFSSDNVRIDSGRVTVILPDPDIELTSTKIDHRNIKEFTSYGRPSFTAAELSMIEKQGRAAIVASIPQMGIVDDTRRSAYNIIVPMLTAMGYEPGNITVEFRKDFSRNDYYNSILILDNNLK